MTGFILSFLILLSVSLFSCGDFSDTCDDLIEKVCDDCSEESCDEWKAMSKNEWMDEHYCVWKLEVFEDEIAPYCNEE